jgi:hypothetical protein
MRNYLIRLITLAFAALVCAPSSARATFVVEASVDGGTFVTLASGSDFTSLSFSGSLKKNGSGHTVIGGSGDTVKITTLGSSSDNAASASDLFTSTTQVQNLTSGKHTITIEVTQTNYTLPGGSSSKLDFQSQVSGTTTTKNPGGSVTFQSYANNSNGAFDTSGATTTGPQSLTLSAPGNSSDNNTALTKFQRTMPEYSVTSIGSITLAGNEKMNYSASLNLTAATPAPPGLVLVLTSLPVLALGLWLRRRKLSLVAG